MSWALVDPQGQTFALVEAHEDVALRVGSRQREFESVMSDFYESVCKTLGYELKEKHQTTGYVALERLGSAIVETSALRALGLSDEKWLWHDERQEDDLRWSEPSSALWREMRDTLQPRDARNVLAQSRSPSREVEASRSIRAASATPDRLIL